MCDKTRGLFFRTHSRRATPVLAPVGRLTCSSSCSPSPSPPPHCQPLISLVQSPISSLAVDRSNCVTFSPASLSPLLTGLVCLCPSDRQTGRDNLLASKLRLQEQQKDVSQLPVSTYRTRHLKQLRLPGAQDRLSLPVSFAERFETLWSSKKNTR